MRSLRAFGSVVVLLAVTGCGAAGARAGATDGDVASPVPRDAATAEPHGVTSPAPRDATSPVPRVPVKTPEAQPSMDPASITVLVTFVGGPADGRTRPLPLTVVRDGITVLGTHYEPARTTQPEVIDTSEGPAQVFRPG
ncbi:hypothetical protein [Streptomyces sp. Tue6028]|uniref:hypothetical protein n=1 Tax=Streptomyces sp. Tue6028 TaxID=2036037 RepID=UPI003D72E091